MTSKRLVVHGDDLEVGLLVSPHSRVQEPDGEIPDHPLAIMKALEEGREAEKGPRFAGMPFRLISVDLPYAVASLILPNGRQNGPHIFDLRRTRLMRLSETYVDGILAMGKELVDQAEEHGESEGSGFGSMEEPMRGKSEQRQRRLRRRPLEGGHESQHQPQHQPPPGTGARPLRGDGPNPRVGPLSRRRRRRPGPLRRACGALFDLWRRCRRGRREGSVGS